MKDSSKLLNFNPRRELSFNPNRALSITPSRRLSFDPNRQPPFGRRGVVFRGYVCPVCGALVDRDARACDECGVKFSTQKRAASEPDPKKREEKRREFTCPVCATLIPAGAKNCSKCGVLFSDDRRVPPPPHGGVPNCPRCGIKVAAEVDYCPRCGEPTSPRARAAHARAQETKAPHPRQPVVQRLGGPAKAKQRPATVSIEEYLRWHREKEGGVK